RRPRGRRFFSRILPAIAVICRIKFDVNNSSLSWQKSYAPQKFRLVPVLNSGSTRQQMLFGNTLIAIG
ncbi:MAG: hypothetical protein ACRC8E_13455, partial [Plesiomonas shigelloides]